MHVGVTTGADMARPYLTLDGSGADGAQSSDGRIGGTYVHGLFAMGTARAAILGSLGAHATAEDHSAAVDKALDEIAAVLEKALAVGDIAALAGVKR